MMPSKIGAKLNISGLKLKKKTKTKARKCRGVSTVKSREKTRQCRENWSQQLEHKQVPKCGTEQGIRKDVCPAGMPHLLQTLHGNHS